MSMFILTLQPRLQIGTLVHKYSVVSRAKCVCECIYLYQRRHIYVRVSMSLCEPRYQPV